MLTTQTRGIDVIDPDQIELRAVDCLQKIRMERVPLNVRELRAVSGLKGETVSFQIAYRYRTEYFSSQMKRQATKNPSVRWDVVSPLKPFVRVRRVVCMPSAYPAYSLSDQGYLSTEPGLYPDLLRDMGETFQVIPYYYRSLWVDVEIPGDAEAGVYPLVFRLFGLDGACLKELPLRVEVADCVLEEQKLIHTEWFYADCIADFYRVKVFSEDFWSLVDRFMQPMVKRGINMILTPLFTYPLDTLIGGERTTVQLVRVAADGGRYRFDFARLERWVALAKKNGFSYFEMSHLFSQWGAKYAPKIVAETGGEEKTIFGWNTEAAGGAYRNFLAQFLPALDAELKKLGIASSTYFHISDEPNAGNIETYRLAREAVAPYLKDYPVFDALSTLEFFQKGIVSMPVPTNEHIMEFLAEGVKEPWVYYCSGEYRNVSNRFFAMPSYRARILGIQMYRYGIRGFLHWGYNFYNSQYSLRHLNPYEVTDADDAFPSGDSFLVYPGEQGRPEESIRMMLMLEAVQDMRALSALEAKKGRAHVLDLIRGLAGMEITFDRFPLSSDFILDLREAVNRELSGA